jgi:tetratricopeptide (TPR) repeat protein
MDDRRPLLSPSPFQDDGPVLGGPTLLREVLPQLMFQVSDSVARAHAAANPAPAVAMRVARDLMVAECRKAQPDQTALRTCLFAYVRKLEASRFLEAAEFADLVATFRVLRGLVDGLAPTDTSRDHDTWIALNALSEAYAQKEDWTSAVQVLARFACKPDGTPQYAPAGSTWLASRYNDYVKKLEDADTDLQASDYLHKVDELAATGDLFLSAIRSLDWPATELGAPKGYYVRDALKALGNVVSIAAEYSPVDRKRAMLERSRRYLAECAQRVVEVDASPIDHNNLADLYRQLAEAATAEGKDADARGYYVEAHREIDRAITDAARPDPAFYHTQALVFRSQRRTEDALRALDSYTEEHAAQGDVLDIEQYVRNRILAAKLQRDWDVADESPDFARIVSTLERVRTFLDRQRGSLPSSTVDPLEGEVGQYLGFALLRWPGHEKQSLDVFARLFALMDWQPPAAVAVRCRVASAQAGTRLARRLRAEFSRGEAERRRKQAAADLDRVRRSIDSLLIDAKVAAGHRQRNLRLRLDAAVAFQMLAEEQFSAEETDGAKALSATTEELVAPLHEASIDNVFSGDDVPEIKERIGQMRARLSFVSALIAIRKNPSLDGWDFIHQVRASLDDARGQNTELDCRVDLALGGLLLAAARLGKGDVRELYRQAIAAFERAAGRDVPNLRADTILALSAAYAEGRTVLRQKPSAAADK